MQIDYVQIVSILANVGVVLGFIFLVIEVRQNNQMNRTNAWNSLLRSGIEFNDQIMVTPDLADILAKGNNNEELTMESRYAYNLSRLGPCNASGSTTGKSRRE